MIQLSTVHFYSYLCDIHLHVEEDMIILFQGSQRTMMCIEKKILQFYSSFATQVVR